MMGFLRRFLDSLLNVPLNWLAPPSVVESLPRLVEPIDPFVTAVEQAVNRKAPEPARTLMNRIAFIARSAPEPFEVTLADLAGVNGAEVQSIAFSNIIEASEVDDPTMLELTAAQYALDLYRLPPAEFDRLMSLMRGSFKVWERVRGI